MFKINSENEIQGADEYTEADAWCDARDMEADEYYDYEYPNVDWNY